MNEIYCSVNIPSRGRKDKLRTCIQSIYNLAKYKDNLEILIRLDDDDLESRELFKEDWCKEIKHLIVFTGPRVGYEYGWILVKDMFQICKGEIIVPISDDFVFRFKDWDEYCYFNFKDKAVVAGWKSRLFLTRKIINQNEFIRNFAYKNYGGDYEVFNYAWKNNFFEKARKLYYKIDENDKTKQEAYGGWKLQDLSILNNLTWTKIHG